ncbi:MAG: hypothetical protein OXE04_03480 [bacterium]|nr:hypothetical protein [bacterium]
MSKQDTQIPPPYGRWLNDSHVQPALPRYGAGCWFFVEAFGALPMCHRWLYP